MDTRDGGKDDEDPAGRPGAVPEIVDADSDARRAEKQRRIEARRDRRRRALASDGTEDDSETETDEDRAEAIAARRAARRKRFEAEGRTRPGRRPADAGQTLDVEPAADAAPMDVAPVEAAPFEAGPGDAGTPAGGTPGREDRGSEAPGEDRPGAGEPERKVLSKTGPAKAGPGGATPPDGSRAEGPREEGPRADGPGAGGPRAAGPRAGGPRQRPGGAAPGAGTPPAGEQARAADTGSDDTPPPGKGGAGRKAGPGKGGALAPRRADAPARRPEDLPTETAREQPPAQAKPATAESVTPYARPMPGRARVSGRRSRWPLILTFLLCVAAPGGYAIHYLYWVAVDRFHSVVGFSVRSEEPAAAPELPIALPSGITGALDADILYEFIRSQQMVEAIDAELDLRAIYNRHPEDWVFAFGDGPIEEMVDHWRYMVDVNYDTSTALIEITAHAYRPEDARAIAAAILRESTTLINSLSQTAREDAIRYAERDLQEAEARLKEIRLALRSFRDRTQTADPTRDVEVQMGVIMALQQQLAEALIARAEILDVSRPGDPRVAELDRRIKAIEAQIEAEKSKLGTGGDDADAALADRIGTFEELTTDLEFAEEAYKVAKQAFDMARIEARRQTRYLATHIEPTLPESSQYPQRALIAALLIGALLAIWGVLMLIWYNVHDRR